MAGGTYPVCEVIGALDGIVEAGKTRGHHDWTDDDDRMSHAVDCLTVVLERSDADSRKARLLCAARELVLMAAIPDARAGS